MRFCLPFAIPLALAASSCADGPRIEARYAPEFTPGRSTIAVLGAFHGGRLSADSWYPLAPHVSSALGRSKCDAAFGDTLKQADPELYEKIDADVAENGITDEMLARLAPKTDADVIMTFTVHGTLKRAVAPSSAGARDPMMPGYRSATAASNPGRGRRGRGRVVEWRGVEIAASLFSVKLGRSVGRITLRYGGSNVEAGLGVFASRLGAELPGSTCRGWQWAAK